MIIEFKKQEETLYANVKKEGETTATVVIHLPREDHRSTAELNDLDIEEKKTLVLRHGQIGNFVDLFD